MVTDMPTAITRASNNPIRGSLKVSIKTRSIMTPGQGIIPREAATNKLFFDDVWWDRRVCLHTFRGCDLLFIQTRRQVGISGTLEARDGFQELQDGFMRFQKYQPVGG